MTSIPHIETNDGKNKYNNTIRKPIMILLYADEKGYTLIKSLEKNLQRALPNIQTRIVYILGLSYHLSFKISRISHYLKSNMILYIILFVVLKTVMRITLVKVHDD